MLKRWRSTLPNIGSMSRWRRKEGKRAGLGKDTLVTAIVTSWTRWRTSWLQRIMSISALTLTTSGRLVDDPAGKLGLFEAGSIWRLSKGTKKFEEWRSRRWDRAHYVDETHLDGRFDQSVPIGRKANVRKFFFSELHDLWRLSRIFQDQENQAGQLKWTGFPPWTMSMANHLWILYCSFQNLCWHTIFHYRFTSLMHLSFIMTISVRPLTTTERLSLFFFGLLKRKINTFWGIMACFQKLTVGLPSSRKNLPDPQWVASCQGSQTHKRGRRSRRKSHVLWFQPWIKSSTRH